MSFFKTSMLGLVTVSHFFIVLGQALFGLPVMPPWGIVGL